MAKTINHDLSPEDLAWLKRLSDEIWQINPSPGNIHGDAYRTEKRRLSKAEWNLLKRIVSSCELPCLPGGGTFGLGFSLTVCNHTPLP